MKDFECDVYLDLMPLVKDGVASEASGRALREHLAVCPKCREQFGEMPETPETVPDDGLKRLKRKVNLRTAFVLSLAVICFLIPLVIGAVFSGNPISVVIIQNHAQDYLNEQYPGHDFEISAPQYHMKSLGYVVNVQSRSSKDTHFMLTYGYFGGDCWDGYEDFVQSGNNTFSRIRQEVHKQLEPALRRGLTDTDRFFVDLNSDVSSIYDEYEYPFSAPEELKIGELEIDGYYDPLELSAKYGHVEIHREVSRVSAEEIADILTQVYEALSAQGMAVRTLDVTIYSQESAMTVAGFLFDDIPAENLVSKVQQSAEQWDEFYEEYEAWLLAKNEK